MEGGGRQCEPLMCALETLAKVAWNDDEVRGLTWRPTHPSSLVAQTPPAQPERRGGLLQTGAGTCSGRQSCMCMYLIGANNAAWMMPLMAELPRCASALTSCYSND